MEDVKQKIAEYLKAHNVLTLARVTADGKPLASTVEYASDGTTLYISTRRTTRKIQDITNNSKVAVTVDHDYLNWLEIQGVQMEAIASILTDEEDINKATHMYVEKFPFVANFPPNPDRIFIKLDLVQGYFIDYTKGFGYKDEVMF